MTNMMIQNFITTRNQQLNANVKPTVLHPIASKGVTASEAKGKLVKENLLQSIGSNIKGYATSIKYFADAIQGKGNDYTVGQINDASVRLGSLGIAGMLAAGAMSPVTRGMKYVGFTTWFAAMALWPKAIAKPLEMMTGVDITQKYENKAGHRKMFFQDPQYICWDLMSDKKIDAVGDKLNIPKNIENRRDAIKEKMKQVAIQGNTMTMLTAGFATPVLATLIADQAQKPFTQAVEMVRTARAEKALGQLSSNVAMNTKKDVIGQLDNIMIGRKSLEVDTLKQVETLIEKEFQGTGLEGVLKKQLNNLSGQSGMDIKIDKKLIDQIAGKIEISKELNLEIGEKAYKQIFGDIKTINDQEIKKIRRKARVYFAKTGNKEVGEKFVKSLESYANTNKVASASVDKVRSLLKVADDFVARKTLVDNYSKATIGNIADSITANNWAKNPQEIIKALGFDNNTIKEIAENSANSEKVQKIIFERLEELVKDPAELTKATDKLEDVVRFSISKEEAAAKVLLKNLSELSGVSSKKAAEEGFEFLEQGIKNVCGAEKTNVVDKIANTKSSFYRVFNVLDAFKIRKNKNVKKVLMSKTGIDNFTNKLESVGVKTKEQFELIMKDLFAPVKSLNLADDVRKSVDGHNKEMKKVLGAIENEIKPTLTLVGENIDAGSLAKRVGKTFKDLVVDASVNANIYKTGMKRIALFGASLFGVTMFALTQFGKTNKYNPDVYKVKGGVGNAGQ